MCQTLFELGVSVTNVHVDKDRTELNYLLPLNEVGTPLSWML